MFRILLARTMIATAVGFAGQSIVAAPVIVESAPLAKRTVLIDAGALSGDPVASALLTRKLRAAAKAVCDQEYPGDMANFAHACISGSYGEAVEQLDRLRSRREAVRSAAGRVAIIVQAR
jgi:hypothetical protein